MSAFKDISNQEFGLLTAIQFVGTTKKWLCRCECGEEKIVARGDLCGFRSISCGKGPCREKAGEFLKANGLARKTTAEQMAYHSMKQRCLNPSHQFFDHYGGRGITIHHSWLGPTGFAQFLKDVGERPSPQHSLDRYPNNNGNYEPGNVRWATQSQQLRNTRVNRLITAFGKTMTMADWADEIGMPYKTLKARIKYGMEITRALTLPIQPARGGKPKQERKASAKLYALKAKEETEATETGE